MRKTGQVLHSTDWNNFRLIAAWRKEVIAARTEVEQE
jgi:hypothetical protein